MAHPYYHALSSAKKFGGQVHAYLPIHSWLDGSKAFYANIRHRALRHSTEGIELANELFGRTIDNGDQSIPLTKVAIQHVTEDCGFVPTTQDWLRHFNPKPWMKEVRTVPTELVADASARQYGGETTDYLPIHHFIDQLGNDVPTMAIRHHAEGIFLAEARFGIVITNASGRKVPVRFLGEQHLRLHFRQIPTAADWLSAIRTQDWMRKIGAKLESP
jgi:hypothetical protein